MFSVTGATLLKTWTCMSSYSLATDQASEMATWSSGLTLAVPHLGNVLCCHATPRDDNEIFTRVTPESRLLPLFEDRGADLVVCGHIQATAYPQASAFDVRHPATEAQMLEVFESAATG
jgi:hypothetical protein